MAVSGRKFSDLCSTVSRGSAEDLDHKCDPCSTIGQKIEAHGLCVDCQEHLCKTCYECHLRTKASREHQLIEKDKIDERTLSRKSVKECTEKCSEHKKEIIKFYCVNHEVLGCNDCMTIRHRTCTLDYIPVACEHIDDSKEYTQVMKKLDQNLKEASKFLEEALDKSKGIESSYAEITKKIIDFRKEINERLDELQEKLMENAYTMMNEEKQKAQGVLESCTSIISEIKKFQTSLRDEKTAKQNEQLYITIKRAQTCLKSDELKKNEKVLEDTRVQFRFERNDNLENIIRPKLFGKVDRKARHSGECCGKGKSYTITKSPDFLGFGFQVRSTSVRTYIAKVHDGSPAKSAGLTSGDRIVEVEGVNVMNETHEKVAERIKAAGDRLTLSIID